MTDSLEVAAPTPEPPRPPPAAWWHLVPDITAVVAVVVLSLNHQIEGTTALMAILAIQAGRLYPRAPGGKIPPGSGGPGIPSGLVTIAVATALGIQDAFRVALPVPLDHPTPTERKPALWLVANAVPAVAPRPCSAASSHA